MSEPRSLLIDDTQSEPIRTHSIRVAGRNSIEFDPNKESESQHELVEKNVARIGVGVHHIETMRVVQNASVHEGIRPIVAFSTNPTDKHSLCRGGISNAEVSSAAGDGGPGGVIDGGR